MLRGMQFVFDFQTNVLRYTWNAPHVTLLEETGDTLKCYRR